jgi:nucleolar protein 56
MAKFIFSNVIGSFVFENFKIVDSIIFKSTEDYKGKKKFEEKLIKKHGNLQEPKDKELYSILSFFKDKRYFSQFYNHNLNLTRDSIKDSVSSDLLIIQATSCIEEIERNVNLLAKRLREWYSYYNPEISNKIEDHENFIFTILKQSKKQLLKELGVDEKNALGADMKEKDVSAILMLAEQIDSFYQLKKRYEDYIKDIEKEVCPNFATVAGPVVAAKLISHAGSMKRLVEMPSSTIQVIGAEKALFRHMRNKKRNLPPKYGILHEHQLIQKSKQAMHGKVARALADKLSIAVKIDYFKGRFIGDKLKKQLVDKFNIQY